MRRPDSRTQRIKKVHPMRKQIDVVAARDGAHAARAYAEQTLHIYRQCARRKPDGTKHFAHLLPYRPHFVEALVYLRHYLKEPLTG